VNVNGSRFGRERAIDLGVEGDQQVHGAGNGIDGIDFAFPGGENSVIADDDRPGGQRVLEVQRGDLAAGIRLEGVDLAIEVAGVDGTIDQDGLGPEPFLARKLPLEAAIRRVNGVQVAVERPDIDRAASDQV